MADKHLQGQGGGGVGCRGSMGKKEDMQNTLNNKDTLKHKKKRYTVSLVINVKHTFWFT